MGNNVLKISYIEKGDCAYFITGIAGSRYLLAWLCYEQENH